MEGGEEVMVKIYKSLIIKGEKKISDVPKRIREGVNAALIQDGYAELADS